MSGVGWYGWEWGEMRVRKDREKLEKRCDEEVKGDNDVIRKV